MYRLYKSGNGQVKQVPVNDPTEDQGIEEKFPNPLEAKGENSNEAPFVEQQRNQFDLIKQNESDQARFQTKKLQNSNYQIVNFKITPTDSAVAQAFYFANYNIATTVGTALSDGVMFGSNTTDVSQAKYYNIVYANARFLEANTTASNTIVSPSFIEFYPMQKINTGDPTTDIFGGKIPTQIESVTRNTSSIAINNTGTEYGVQSFGIDLYNENAYYSQSNDLKGIRCCGLALKLIDLNFGLNLTLSGIRIIVEIGIDLNTEGNNY